MLPVRGFEASRGFYLSALAPLGFGIVEEAEDEATFGAEAAYDVFSIAATGERPCGGVHLAFSAKDRGSGRLPRCGPRGGRTRQRRPGSQAALPGRLLRRLRLRFRREQRGGRPPRLGPASGPETPPEDTFLDGLFGSVSSPSCSSECVEGVFSEVQIRGLHGSSSCTGTIQCSHLGCPTGNHKISGYGIDMRSRERC